MPFRHTLRTLFGSLLLTTAAHADAPRVAVDIMPVHALVAQVMGDLGTPDLILPPNASPHGFSMRPSQARMLENADRKRKAQPVTATHIFDAGGRVDAGHLGDGPARLFL